MFFIFLILNIVIFLTLDSLWFRFIAGDFFKKQMASIALIKDGSFTPRMAPAAFVYLLMSFALEYFVFFLPDANNQTSIMSVLLNSALIGLVNFGIYDFTNRAVLKDYPLILSIVDTGWGVFIFSSTGLLSMLIRTSFGF